MRLFVAVWPPAEVVSALRALPRPTLAGLRWTTEDQWHVTLRFLGEAQVEEAATALADPLLLPSAVEANLGTRVERFGGRVVQVPVTGLDRLAAAVVAATAAVGERPPDRPFRGHLTLGRANRGRADLRPAVGTAVPPLRWPVDEVTLVGSRLHPQGARYRVLDRTSVRNYTAGTTPP